MNKPPPRSVANVWTRALAATLSCAALAALGACSSPTPAFDLSAAREPVRGGIAGQLVVPEPIALQTLEDVSILVKSGGSVSQLGGGQWADRLPRLIQARLIQTFENSSKIKAVGRPGDGTTATQQLTTEIRAFQLDPQAGSVVAEISAKRIELSSGRIVAARVFSSRVPVSSNKAPEVAQALDRALSSVLLDIVRWSSSGR